MAGRFGCCGHNGSDGEIKREGSLISLLFLHYFAPSFFLAEGGFLA